MTSPPSPTPSPPSIGGSTAIPVTRSVRSPAGPVTTSSSPTPTPRRRAATRPTTISSSPMGRRPSKKCGSVDPTTGSTPATSKPSVPAVATTAPNREAPATSGSLSSSARTASGSSPPPCPRRSRSPRPSGPALDQPVQAGPEGQCPGQDGDDDRHAHERRPSASSSRGPGGRAEAEGPSPPAPAGASPPRPRTARLDGPRPLVLGCGDGDEHPAEERGGDGQGDRQEDQGVEPAARVGLDVEDEAPGEEARGGVREADGQRRPHHHGDRGVDQLIGDDLASGHADRAELATLGLRQAELAAEELPHHGHRGDARDRGQDRQRLALGVDRRPDLVRHPVATVDGELAGVRQPVELGAQVTDRRSRVSVATLIVADTPTSPSSRAGGKIGQAVVRSGVRTARRSPRRGWRSAAARPGPRRRTRVRRPAAAGSPRGRSGPRAMRASTPGTIGWRRTRRPPPGRGATVDDSQSERPGRPANTSASAAASGLVPSGASPPNTKVADVHVVDRRQRRHLGGARFPAALLDGCPVPAVRLGVAIGSGQGPDGTGGQHQDDPEGDRDGDGQCRVRLRPGSEPASQAVEDGDHTRSEAQAHPPGTSMPAPTLAGEASTPTPSPAATCSLPPGGDSSRVGRGQLPGEGGCGAAAGVRGRPRGGRRRGRLRLAAGRRRRARPRRRADRHPHAAHRHRRGHPGRGDDPGRPPRRSVSWC